jgi:hypothetical protein
MVMESQIALMHALTRLDQQLCTDALIETVMALPIKMMIVRMYQVLQSIVVARFRILIRTVSMMRKISVQLFLGLPVIKVAQFLILMEME